MPPTPLRLSIWPNRSSHKEEHKGISTQGTSRELLDFLLHLALCLAVLPGVLDPEKTKNGRLHGCFFAPGLIKWTPGDVGKCIIVDVNFDILIYTLFARYAKDSKSRFSTIAAAASIHA